MQHSHHFVNLPDIETENCRILNFNERLVLFLFLIPNSILNWWIHLQKVSYISHSHKMCLKPPLPNNFYKTLMSFIKWLSSREIRSKQSKNENLLDNCNFVHSIVDFNSGGKVEISWGLMEKIIKFSNSVRWMP